MHVCLPKSSPGPQYERPHAHTAANPLAPPPPPSQAGYTMLAIDDGWGAYNRNATGHIVADPEK